MRTPWKHRSRSAAGAVLVLTLAVSSFPQLLDSSNAAATGTAPTISSCPTFPADNVWNARVDTLPVDSHSSAYISSIGPTVGLHADFGSGLWNGGPIGIPYTTVPGTQPRVAINFTLYGDESDPGPYPIPTNAPIEGGSSSTGDRHVLVVDRDNCVLYEMYYAFPQSNGSWNAGSGAVFNLNVDGPLRPAGWTSADAAGLPILPGLVRYDEVAAGQINHAVRFTAQYTQKAYIWPARHFASSNISTSVPPMGTRVRLKSSTDISGFSQHNQVILRALKTYGMILADNGSNWYITGTPDSNWDNSDLHLLGNIHGSDFEVVDSSSLMVDPNSGQAAGGGSTVTATPTGAASTPTPTPTSSAAATPTVGLLTTATPTPTGTPVRKGKRK